MIDKFLNFGSIFDWITPLIAFLQDLIYGPVSDFGIPANIGWSQRDIKLLFTNYGLQAWGFIYYFDDETLMFTTRKSDAEDAYYVLESAGIPIICAPIEVFY